MITITYKKYGVYDCSQELIKGDKKLLRADANTQRGES